MGRGATSPSAAANAAVAARPRVAKPRRTVPPRPTRVVLKDGTVEYRLRGELHRDRGPARVRPDGTREWWRNGFPCRLDDGPSVEHADGSCDWVTAWGFDRDDGPARVGADGSREYWQAGELHRDDDQPARIHADGTREFWVRGRMHRDGDQPAYVGADGERRWMRDGELHRVSGPAHITRAGVGLFYRDGMPCPPPALVHPADVAALAMAA